MTEFIFNEQNVCKNPEIITVYDQGKYKIQISVAQTPHGTWCAGYRFAYPTGYSGCGAGFGRYRKESETREQAIQSVARQFRSFVNEHKYPAAAIAALESLLPLDEVAGGLFA